MKATIKAYTAGILDGEGSISAYESGYDGNYTLRITVVQRNDRIELLEFLHTHWGGTAHNHDATNGRNNTYSWTIRAKEAKKMLLKILPYLMLKKPAARLAIAWQILTEAYTAYRYTQGRGLALPEDIKQARARMKAMFTDLNSRHPNLVTVAETERENLINEVRALAKVYQDATVHSKRIVNS